MKKRLVDGETEALGGEFFLAEYWLVNKIWAVGKHAASQAGDETES